MTALIDFLTNNPLLAVFILIGVGFVVFDLMRVRRRRQANRVALESPAILSEALAATKDPRPRSVENEEAVELEPDPVSRADESDSAASQQEIREVTEVTEVIGDDSGEEDGEEEDAPDNKVYHRSPQSDATADVPRTLRTTRPTVDDLLEEADGEKGVRERIVRILKERRQQSELEPQLPTAVITPSSLVSSEDSSTADDSEREGTDTPQDSSIEDQNDSVDAADEEGDESKDVELEAVKAKVRDFYIELKQESKRLSQEREELERERLAFSRERADTSVRTETASSALSVLDEQHEALDREQRELISERARLREMRAELEGTRAALETERINLVRDKAGIDSLREKLEGDCCRSS